MQIDPKKPFESTNAYFEIPSRKNELASQTSGHSGSKFNITHGVLTLSQHDEFIISTLVCSTKLTHDGEYKLSWI